MSGHWWLAVDIYAAKHSLGGPIGRDCQRPLATRRRQRGKGKESSFLSSFHTVAVLRLWRVCFVCRLQRFNETGRLKQRLARRRAFANANDNLAKNNPSGNCSVVHFVCPRTRWPSLRKTERLNQKWTGQAKRWDALKTVNNRWSLFWCEPAGRPKRQWQRRTKRL